MFIVIAGGGKLGANLATLLVDAGHEVTVIEQSVARTACLTEEQPRLNVIRGDACEPAILEAAHIARADAVAAVTGDDEDNLVVCLLGRREYGVGLSIARVNDPRNEWLFDARFGVDVAVSNTAIIARLLNEEIGLGNLVTLLKMLKNDLALLELSVRAGAPVVGVALKDTPLPLDARLIAVVRGGDVEVPHADTVLAEGDDVLAISNVGSQPELKRLLLGDTA